MKERRYEIGVGILLVVSLGLLGWLALQVGAIGSFAPQVHVTLRVQDAAGLDEGAEIAVAGVKVGSIGRLRVDGSQAVAELAIDRDAGLRQDVGVRIRSRSILGEKYLELAPKGSDAPLLADGDELALPGDQVELDEMVAALGPVVAAVDPAALGDAIRAVVDAVRDDPEALKRAVANADRLLANGAEASESLPELVARADSTLDRADRALDALTARLSEAKSPIGKADAVLDDLQAAAEPLDEAVAEARTTLADARGALADARGLLAEVDGIGPDLKKVLANFSEIDKWELRRLLREEGILIRIKERTVEPDSP